MNDELRLLRKLYQAIEAKRAAPFSLPSLERDIENALDALRTFYRVRPETVD